MIVFLICFKCTILFVWMRAVDFSKTPLILTGKRIFFLLFLFQKIFLDWIGIHFKMISMVRWISFVNLEVSLVLCGWCFSLFIDQYQLDRLSVTFFWLMSYGLNVIEKWDFIDESGEFFWFVIGLFLEVISEEFVSDFGSRPHFGDA